MAKTEWWEHVNLFLLNPTIKLNVQLILNAVVDSKCSTVADLFKEEIDMFPLPDNYIRIPISILLSKTKITNPFQLNFLANVCAKLWKDMGIVISKDSQNAMIQNSLHFKLDERTIKNINRFYFSHGLIPPAVGVGFLTSPFLVNPL